MVILLSDFDFSVPHFTYVVSEGIFKEQNVVK